MHSYPSQRNRCSCYIQLKEYEKATEAIQHAKRHDHHCPQTQFLIFKLALLLNKEEEGNCREGGWGVGEEMYVRE